MLLTLFTFILLGEYMEAADSTYYFTTFGSDNDQKLYIYSSADGVNFSLFDHTSFTGNTSVLRDPALMFGLGSSLSLLKTDLPPFLCIIF